MQSFRGAVGASIVFWAGNKQSKQAFKLNGCRTGALDRCLDPPPPSTPTMPLSQNSPSILGRRKRSKLLWSSEQEFSASWRNVQKRRRTEQGEWKRGERNDSGEMGILESLCQVSKQQTKSVFYRTSTGRWDEESPVAKWWHPSVLQWPALSFIPAEEQLLNINSTLTPTGNCRCSTSSIIWNKLQFTSESRANRKSLTGRWELWRWLCHLDSMQFQPLDQVGRQLQGKVCTAPATARGLQNIESTRDRLSTAENQGATSTSMLVYGATAIFLFHNIGGYKSRN